MKVLICLILLWPLPLFKAVELSSRQLRIVLLGKTGAGKSSSGNIILGRNAFKVARSFKSVTSVSEMERGTVYGKKITVVDTPGVFDTTKTVAEVRTEIEKCVNYSLPGPHVFLLVIRADVRFTVEEKNAVKWIQTNFGKRAAKFTMVLFTHRNGMEEISVEDIADNEDLRTLIGSCGGEYQTFNIAEREDKTQVEKLLKKIDALVDENEGEYYTNKMYQEVQRKREEAQKKLLKEREEDQSFINAMYMYLKKFLKYNPFSCPSLGESENIYGASSNDPEMYDVTQEELAKIVDKLKERIDKLEREGAEETWRD